MKEYIHIIPKVLLIFNDSTALHSLNIDFKYQEPIEFVGQGPTNSMGSYKVL